jgi:hypothetical protein
LQYLRTERTELDELTEYPGNARVHDDKSLDESVRLNGQYRSIVARELDDGKLQILAGHGTANALRRKGNTHARVEVIRADDREARRIVLADNGTSRNAGYDDALLLDLLDAASRDGGLGGSGWDSDAYNVLLSKSNENPFDEEPLTEQADDSAQLPEGFHVLVTCDDERAQGELLERFISEGLNVRALTA